MAQSLQLGAHQTRHIQRVCAWRRVNSQISRVVAVQRRAGVVATRADINKGDIPQPHQLPLCRAADNDIAERFRAVQAAKAVNGQRLLLAVKHRWRADLSGSALHVLLADREGDIVGGNIQRIHPLRVQPDTHTVIARTEHLHLAHARQSRQRITNVGAGVVADKQRIPGLVRRKKTDAQHQVGGALADLHPHFLYLLRQLGHGLRHAVLHINGRQIGIGAGGKGDRQRIAAIVRTGGFHIQHMVHAVDLCFQRGRYRFGHV